MSSGRRTRSSASKAEDTSIQNNSSNISASTVESDGESVSTESGDFCHISNGALNNDMRGRKGRKSKIITNKKKINFKYASMLKEEHNQPIFGVSFNHLVNESENDPLFATVGSNRISIYECPRESIDIRLLLGYVDTDVTESFFTCAWSRDQHSSLPLLAAAGARGIVRIIQPFGKTSIRNYSGNGQAINEIIFLPTDFNLLLSASKDYTLRLWNVLTDTCIAIFGGVEGHRDEILSLDVSQDGRMMASCGIDHSIKIWKLDVPPIQTAIENSYLTRKIEKENRKTSNPLFVYFPDFSTRDVHSNYVDCVRWWNALLLTKSCDNRIVCWKADLTPAISLDSPKGFRHNDGLPKSLISDGSVLSLFDLEYNNCDIWFMKFALDTSKQILALGNQVGKIYIWDLCAEDLNQSKPIILSTPKCTTAVRQIAFSANSTVLISVCDDATVWRWNLLQP